VNRVKNSGTINKDFPTILDSMCRRGGCISREFANGHDAIHHRARVVGDTSLQFVQIGHKVHPLSIGTRPKQVHTRPNCTTVTCWYAVADASACARTRARPDHELRPNFTRSF
jgi:hypothetical protein